MAATRPTGAGSPYDHRTIRPYDRMIFPYTATHATVVGANRHSEEHGEYALLKYTLRNQKEHNVQRFLTTFSPLVLIGGGQRRGEWVQASRIAAGPCRNGSEFDSTGGGHSAGNAITFIDTEKSSAFKYNRTDKHSGS